MTDPENVIAESDEVKNVSCVRVNNLFYLNEIDFYCGNRRIHVM